MSVVSSVVCSSSSVLYKELIPIYQFFWSQQSSMVLTIFEGVCGSGKSSLTRKLNKLHDRCCSPSLGLLDYGELLEEYDIFKEKQKSPGINATYTALHAKRLLFEHGPFAVVCDRSPVSVPLYDRVFYYMDHVSEAQGLIDGHTRDSDWEDFLERGKDGEIPAVFIEPIVVLVCSRVEWCRRRVLERNGTAGDASTVKDKQAGHRYIVLQNVLFRRMAEVWDLPLVDLGEFVSGEDGMDDENLIADCDWDSYHKAVQQAITKRRIRTSFSYDSATSCWVEDLEQASKLNLCNVNLKFRDVHYNVLVAALEQTKLLSRSMHQNNGTGKVGVSGGNSNNSMSSVSEPCQRELDDSKEHYDTLLTPTQIALNGQPRDSHYALAISEQDTPLWNSFITAIMFHKVWKAVLGGSRLFLGVPWAPLFHLYPGVMQRHSTQSYGCVGTICKTNRISTRPS